MKKIKLEIGDIVQINPSHSTYGGQLLVVTEPKEWGCQGIIYMDLEIPCYRVDGRAYLRLKWEDMEFVGKCEWIIREDNENE